MNLKWTHLEIHLKKAEKKPFGTFREVFSKFRWSPVFFYYNISVLFKYCAQGKWKSSYCRGGGSQYFQGPPLQPVASGDREVVSSAMRTPLPPPPTWLPGNAHQQCRQVNDDGSSRWCVCVFESRSWSSTCAATPTAPPTPPPCLLLWWSKSSLLWSALWAQTAQPSVSIFLYLF